MDKHLDWQIRAIRQAGYTMKQTTTKHTKSIEWDDIKGIKNIIHINLKDNTGSYTQHFWDITVTQPWDNVEQFKKFEITKTFNTKEAWNALKGSLKELFAFRRAGR